MSDCCTPSGYRRMFSERSAEAQVKRYRRRGLDATSRRVVEALKRHPLEGRTLLEIGGGVGAIQVELLRAGLARAVSVELTPTYEAAARGLLREHGLEDRVTRRVLDFAEGSAEVPPADYVVMNRVLCCYPDMPKLAGAAATHAQAAMVLSFPRRAWWTRLAITLANLAMRLTRTEFRLFVHPPRQVLAVGAAAGLRAVSDEVGLLWEVAELTRTQLQPAP